MRDPRYLVLAGLLVAWPLLAQAPGLRIVVLEGEGSVNIIQQKTALKALVEVRDRNNQPVSGASVTFMVTGKGGATVAGSQTVTVATNAAGQASLTGMTPASSGGLQISVSASSNGVTATTTITQTVFATAAAAAGATAAVAGGAAAGGGLSTGAIVGIVGGLAAVGGGLAVAGGGGGDDAGDAPNSTTSPNPNPDPNPCTFTISPSPATVLLVPIEGGSYGYSITVSPANCGGPQWRIDTNLASAFVIANPVSGTGNGAFTLTFAPFTPTATFPSRSGAIGVPATFIQFFQPTRF